MKSPAYKVDTRDVSTDRNPTTDEGFTLLELLVVIVILGVLATVVVFAVGGVVDRGRVSALEGDYHTLETAEESHYAVHGTYADEAGLVAAGLLRDQSRLHDIDVSSDGASYTIAEAGTLSGNDGNGGDGDDGDGNDGDGDHSSDTGTPGPGQPGGPPLAAVPQELYPDQTGWSYGSTSSAKTLVIIGSGSGAAGQALWQQISTAGTALRADTQVIWMDSVSTKSDVDAIRASGPTYIIVPVQVPMSGSPGHAYVGQYLDSIMSSPGEFWWGQGQTQAGHPITESIGYYLAHF